MTINKTILTIDISPALGPSSTQELKTDVIQQIKPFCSTYNFLRVEGRSVPIETRRCRNETVLQSGLRLARSAERSPISV